MKYPISRVLFLFLLVLVGSCKKNPVDSLNLSKDHPALGLEELKASNITPISIQMSANATSDGGFPITQRGFEWVSDSNSENVPKSIVAAGSGTGAFTQTLSGLWGGTTYTVKAYVKNEKGTFYSQEIEVVTVEPTLATVQTKEPQQITLTTAFIGGELNNNGGAPVTELGFVWSTQLSPDRNTNDGHIISNLESDTFTETLTDLQLNTTYYVRSYAVSEVGTSYGNEFNFTTLDGVIELNTVEVKNVTVSGAVVSASIHRNGALSFIDRGFVWHSTENPTLDDHAGRTSNGVGLGEFSESLIGLSSNTTYFVRAFGMNEVGVYYGNELSFTTLATPPPLTNSIGMEFTYIESGSFYMGSTQGFGDERPVHKVEISQGFYMGVYEVTQAQWAEVMGTNPSTFQSDETRPVEMVSWDEIQLFIERLNEREGGEHYRLPTEAEWEYCAHAGAAAVGEGPSWHFGNDESLLPDYAWYEPNSGNISSPIGKKLPNPWGVYDMYGNVREWVQDRYSSVYYGESPLVDPQGPDTGADRVIRGGSWSGSSSTTRSTNRGFYFPDYTSSRLGFRLVCME